MPRPDLERLGIKYRRIPILTIGRDVYLDTRLILRTLEEKYPTGKLGSGKPEERFVEKLLERYMVEGPVFATAAGLVPTQFVQDPSFVQDRRGFCGREWTAAALDEGRPECLAYVKSMFDLFETTIFSDGRNWVLRTEKPSLADIEGAYQFSDDTCSLVTVGIGCPVMASILSVQRRALQLNMCPFRGAIRHGA